MYPRSRASVGQPGCDICILKASEPVKISIVRFLPFIFVLITLSLIGSEPQALQTAAATVADNYAHCRFGVTAPPEIASYDVASLNLGWYVDWAINPSPPQPAGIEYVQMVRLRQQGVDGWNFQAGQSWETLTDAIAANSGALWLIGNEPDSPFQDDMVPQSYAHAFHDLHNFIKDQDPTSKVGIGGIVQPTPLRLAYLDKVWDTYYRTYGKTMPVDVWNIHSFILRETTVVPDPEPCGSRTVPVWGAYIPPGAGASMGKLYCIRDQDNLDIFWQRIRDFRRWMANKGERNKPLIISEYGVLFYEDFHDEDGNTFSQERVGEFMIGTFDRMLNETDSTIGYPHDGNRLVQRWAWFSLSENPNDWGGTLFDPDTRALRPLGQTYVDYTSAITPSVDLLAVYAYSEPPVFWYEGKPVTATLKAVVSNAGSIATAESVAVNFYDGPPGEPGTEPIGSVQVVPRELGGCADYAVVSVSWSGLGVGAHSFYVQIDAEGTIAEADETNNVASAIVLVATERVFLPSATKDTN